MKQKFRQKIQKTELQKNNKKKHRVDPFIRIINSLSTNKHTYPSYSQLCWKKNNKKKILYNNENNSIEPKRKKRRKENGSGFFSVVPWDAALIRDLKG